MEVGCPVLVDIGNISKIVPSTIVPAKPYINTRDDEPPVLGLGIIGSGTRQGRALDTRNTLSPGFLAYLRSTNIACNLLTFLTESLESTLCPIIILLAHHVHWLDCFLRVRLRVNYFALMFS